MSTATAATGRISRRWGAGRCGAALLAALLLTPGLAAASVQSELAFHRGVVAYGQGDYATAKTEFEAVLAEDPEDAAAIHYLGLISADEGDFDAAIGYYQRSLAIDPEDVDARLDLGAALLEANRTAEAREAFDAVLAAQPERARAQLFAGIAAYRAGDYQGAIPHLSRAAALDPELRANASYYRGLSEAHLGDFQAAAGAFDVVESQSPATPLSTSARSLREQVEPAAAEGRRWSLSALAGMEYDANPFIAGRPANQIDDWRAVFRVRGNLLLYDDDRFSLVGGYDSFFSIHHDASDVDLQTHVFYGSASANFDPVRFGLRYDYAYTLINMSKPFRGLHRVTPTVAFRESDWGVSQLYYQFQAAEFQRARGGGALERDGTRHSVGFNQFFFVPAPFQYVRVGALGDWNKTAGEEFRYESWEFSTGFGMDLLWDVDFSVLYRLTRRDYRHASIFGGTARDHRDDLQNRLTFELAKPIGQHWQVSTAGSFTFNGSDVNFYDYNREIIGAYVSYQF